MDELDQLLEEIESMLRDECAIGDEYAFTFKILPSDGEAKIRVTVFDKDPEENEKTCIKIGTALIRVTEKEFENYLSDLPLRCGELAA